MHQSSFPRVRLPSERGDARLQQDEQTICCLYPCLVYIGQMFWPKRLAVFYPWPTNGWPIAAIALSVGVLALVTVLAFWFRKNRPYLIVGWLWYLISLSPTLGLIPVGLQAHADAYNLLAAHRSLFCVGLAGRRSRGAISGNAEALDVCSRRPRSQPRPGSPGSRQLHGRARDALATYARRDAEQRCRQLQSRAPSRLAVTGSTMPFAS